MRKSWSGWRQLSAASLAHVCAVLACLAQTHVFAAQNSDKKQSPEKKHGEETSRLQAIAVTGLRAKVHSVTDSPSPVVRIEFKDIERTGQRELGQVLQSLAPSFNFSRTFVSDGTDIVRPATLAGLGPDQVLVLVNGKRRHQQALVNIQQTVGRGSAGFDINAIPVSAIDHIEILRDGAAAQYGSDAVAGVINVLLKEDYGRTQTSVEAGETYQGDGDVHHGSVNSGWQMGAGGFLNLTAEYRNRFETNRAAADEIRVSPPRVTQRIGDADASDRYLWVNSAFALADGELYGFGGASRRNGNSSGFFRAGYDGRTVPAYYPDGFLPTIETRVEDLSAVLGYRMPIGDNWRWDLSYSYGRNELGFHESNTANVSWYYERKPDGSIYAESPREADTGKLALRQDALNLDFSGRIDWGNRPVFAGTGFEYRNENYRIEAGDPVSYTYGRTDNRDIQITDQSGNPAAAGTQGFPGFSPASAIDRSRRNLAAYLDLGQQTTDRLHLGAALRYEHYSDVGSSVVGKLSQRFAFSPAVSLRGTLSTGFRAPGVQQQSYSQLSTNLGGGGGLAETLTPRHDSPVARALGLRPLDEEKSVNASVGLVLAPNADTSLTLDLYQIDIENRIVFSSMIEAERPPQCGANYAGCPIRAILDPLGARQVQFFTNAIDTRTRGLDIAARHGWQLGNGDQFDVLASLSLNHTKVTRRHSVSTILPGERLFDDAQVTLIERGQPRSRGLLSAIWEHGPWSTTLRSNYFGSVQGQGFTPGFVQLWGARWLLDTSISYAFTPQAKLTLGADNLLDTYPTQWNRKEAWPLPQFGFSYCWETCPFGVNGGFYYARFDYTF
ncbi:MAG: TonB-dependent receptor [Rhodanobacteraceae bacterium]|nr:TonB-dependent receptor [Rhodanobacteraceae bacterium]